MAERRTYEPPRLIGLTEVIRWGEGQGEAPMALCSPGGFVGFRPDCIPGANARGGCVHGPDVILGSCTAGPTASPGCSAGSIYGQLGCGNGANVFDAQCASGGFASTTCQVGSTVM